MYCPEQPNLIYASKVTRISIENLSRQNFVIIDRRFFQGLIEFVPSTAFYEPINFFFVFVVESDQGISVRCIELVLRT